MSQQYQKILLSSYRVFRKSGLLDWRFSKKLFSFFYDVYKRNFEDPFYWFSKRHPNILKCGDIYDVGANIGYTASVFLNYLSPGNRLFAFEPESVNFEALSQRLVHHPLANQIHLFQSAVGELCGSTPFWKNQDHPGDHRIITSDFKSRLSPSQSTTVAPMLTLDSIYDRFGGPVSFIKIDVQGYELAVCRGMKNILEKETSVVLGLEFSPESLRALGFNPPDLLRFFNDQGFYFYRLSHRGFLFSIPKNQLFHLESLCEEGGKDYLDLVLSRKPITSPC